MDQLKAATAFVTVVQEGSFTQAAEKLNTSTQLVSNKVTQLETHYGVRLLNRTTRSIQLTEVGSVYFREMLQVLESIDSIEAQIGSLQVQAKGRLRVTAPVSFGTRHLGKFLAEFQSAYPDVTVDLDLNDRKVDLLEEGYDVALRIGHLKTSSLVAKRICPARLVLCAAPAYLDTHGRPTDVSELKEHDFLHYRFFDTTQHQDTLLKAIASAGQNAKLVTNNGDILAQAAIAGAGMILQPTFIIGEALNSGQLETVLPELEPEPLALYAVYAHRRLLPNKTRCFIDFLDGYFGEPPYWDTALPPRQ